MGAPDLATREACRGWRQVRPPWRTRPGRVDSLSGLRFFPKSALMETVMSVNSESPRFHATKEPI
jgi:hypothetical protein